MTGSPGRRKASRTNQADEATLSLLASLVDSSEDAIISKTPTGTITSWNRAAEFMYGWTAQEVIGKSVSVLMPPDQREEMDAILARVRSGERIEHYETARVRKDGTSVDVSLTVSPIRDSSGQLIGVSTIARDITERKQVDEQLHATSRYVRSLIEASLDPLVTISPEGKITDVNEATIQATGVARDDIIGTDFSDYFTEPREAREGYQKVFSQGFVTDYPLTIRHRDGRLMDVLYNASVYRNADGNVLGVFAAARDVSAQRQASRYARSLIEASLDPLVTISPEGKVTDVNEATVKVTGVSRAKLIGTDFSDYFTEPDKAREGYQQVFSRGYVTDYPLTIRHRDATLTDVLYNASLYRDARGEVLGVFAAARDVTERNRAEDELRRHQERLEQLIVERTADLMNRNAQLLAAERARSELLATLNREISHRVKNNLSMVAGMLQMQLASERDPRLAEMLQDAIARLYAFASVHEQLTVTGSGEMDVTAAIRRCAEAARQVFLQGGAAVSVEGDPLQYPGSAAASLSVVANELITNGLKHGGPDGDGHLHIDVRLARDNGALRLSVWNSGNPVPADMDMTQQTGLGLSLVQGLVVGQYGGSFTLGPERGGTLAQVVLDDERLRDG